MKNKYLKEINKISKAMKIKNLVFSLENVYLGQLNSVEKIPQIIENVFHHFYFLYFSLLLYDGSNHFIIIIIAYR